MNRSPSGHSPIHTVTDFNIKLIEVTTMGNIAKQRHQAAVRQYFHCFYCGLPMWEASPAALMQQYRLTPAEARLLQCTREHLQPRGEGGSNQPANIVAACQHCNSTRHKTPKVLSPEQYQKKVRARVGKGGWFPKGITSKVKGSKTNGV
ncbi:HNH endonuclease [Aeromonas hydrophila]|uniref:HNH endonuclease n=1 Tax=Aeromonas hydrophila TaxID=644 RepID=UPI00214BD3F4|nr:HNH endonuclease [Aeromonas hydrophila]